MIRISVTKLLTISESQQEFQDITQARNKSLMSSEADELTQQILQLKILMVDGIASLEQKMTNDIGNLEKNLAIVKCQVSTMVATCTHSTELSGTTASM